jgi:hypothetical protein
MRWLLTVPITNVCPVFIVFNKKGISSEEKKYPSWFLSQKGTQKNVG